MILSTKSDTVDGNFDKVIEVFIMVLRVFAVSSTFFTNFINRLFTIVGIDDSFE